MMELARLLEALRGMPPANSPEWVTLEYEAQRRGKSTEAMRRWCVRHGVQIRQGTHRDAWVRPADVDAAVAGLPLASPAVAALDREVDGGR